MAAVKGQTGAGRVRLGDLLVKAGVITQENLDAALDEQARWGGKLGDLLVRMNFVSEDVFARALSKQLGLARADLNAPIPAAILATLPADVIEAFEILPLALLDDGRTLVVATSDPLNFTVLDHVRAVGGRRVVPYVASAGAIRNAIARIFRNGRGEEPLQFVTNSQDGAMVNETPSLRAEAEKTGQLNPFVSSPPPVTAHSQTIAMPATSVRPPPPPPSFPPEHEGLPPLPSIPLPSIPPPSFPPEASARASAADAAAAGIDGVLPRGDLIALTALVELLLEKKVITLEEYLGRLKR